MKKEEKQPQQKQFVYDWYKELNWNSNPFEFRYVFPVANYLAGYIKEKKKLNYFIIEKQPLCLIRGNDGTGKTTLVLWLKYELSKYKDRVILDYINKHVNLVDFVKLLIKQFLSTKEKLIIASHFMHIQKTASLISDQSLREIYLSVYLKKKDLDFNSIKKFLSTKLGTKHLVLLVDDIDELPTQSIKFIEMLINSNLNLQLILTTAKGSLDIASKKKDYTRVELEGLSFDDAKDMISKRIISVGGIDTEPFTEEQLKVLYQKCNKSPLVFLNLCKDKAIKISLNKVNDSRKKEEIKDIGIIDSKPTKPVVANNNLANKKGTEEVKENKKTYEIKVISNEQDLPYEIKMVKQKEGTTPVKVEKDEAYIAEAKKEKN